MTQDTYHIQPTGEGPTGGCCYWKSKLLTSSTKIRRQHIFKIQTLSISSKWWIWLAINWDNLGKPCSIRGNNLTGRWGELRSLSVPVHGPFWQRFDPTFDPLDNLYYHSLSVLVSQEDFQLNDLDVVFTPLHTLWQLKPVQSWISICDHGKASWHLQHLLAPHRIGISIIYWPPIDLHSNMVYFSHNPGTLTVPSST